MPRLTKKFLDRLKLKSRDVFAWDSEIRGLGVRLKPSGTKTFFVQYRNKSNRTRRLVEVIKGEDPSVERKAARKPAAEGLAGLPSTYDAVPKLGPPPPGDFGDVLHKVETGKGV